MDKILKTIKSSVRNVWVNKLRSVLTILGIVIGIASVTIMVSVGESAQAFIEKSLTERLGSDVLFISPGSEEENMSFSPSPFFESLSDEDYAVFEENRVPGIFAHSRRALDSMKVIYRNKEANALSLLVDVGFFDTMSFNLESGRYFNQQDLDNQTRTVLIDEDAKSILFPLEDPVGKELDIEGKQFTVVGVVESIQTLEGTEIPGVYMLIETYEEVYGKEVMVQAITLKVASPEELKKVQSDVERYLRAARGLAQGEESDFYIQSQEDFLGTISSITDTVTLFIAVIASISLLVGGIGVMNIMLVSVTERVKEVGLRKAIGATNRDIFLQFITESVVFAFIGGVVGLLIGGVVSFGIQKYAKLPLLISTTAVLSSLGVSFFVGFVFGLYPARQAAKLSPIEALHSE